MGYLIISFILILIYNMNNLVELEELTFYQRISAMYLLWYK